MNLLVRFVPNSICIGCACHGYVEDKTHLCCSCFGLKIAVEDRKRKLSSTMRAIFAYCEKIQAREKERLERNLWTVGNPDPDLKEKIKRQMEEFRAG